MSLRKNAAGVSYLPLTPVILSLSAGDKQKMVHDLSSRKVMNHLLHLHVNASHLRVKLTWRWLALTWNGRIVRKSRAATYCRGNLSSRRSLKYHTSCIAKPFSSKLNIRVGPFISCFSIHARILAKCFGTFSRFMPMQGFGSMSAGIVWMKFLAYSRRKGQSKGVPFSRNYKAASIISGFSFCTRRTYLSLQWLRSSISFSFASHLDAMWCKKGVALNNFATSLYSYWPSHSFVDGLLWQH